jgi:Autographiviridae endonuclease VII
MRCGHCSKDKDPEEFNLSRKVSRGRQYNCKECARAIAREHQRAWRARMSPEEQTRYNRNAALKRLYGLTLEAYERLLAAQGGVCAICGKPPGANGGPGTRRFLAVDHNHATDEVRGLLCHHCNVAIGYFHEDPTLLDRAYTYLAQSRNSSLDEIDDIEKRHI